jgi:hypothetical protein
VVEAAPIPGRAESPKGAVCEATLVSAVSGLVGVPVEGFGQRCRGSARGLYACSTIPPSWPLGLGPRIGSRCGGVTPGCGPSTVGGERTVEYLHLYIDSATTDLSVM